jgi:hypothetical protein
MSSKVREALEKRLVTPSDASFVFALMPCYTFDYAIAVYIFATEGSVCRYFMNPDDRVKTPQINHRR